MLTTESNKTKALRLSKLLIQKKLAACVSIKKIFSIYEWEDQIEETKEFEITIKSKPELKNHLIDFLRKFPHMTLLKLSTTNTILRRDILIG